jgi:hypothetical protein
MDRDQPVYKGVTILDNNMYNAPVYYHSVDR